MAAKESIMFVAAVVLLGLCSVGHGLECYRCSNMETDGSNDLLRKMFKGNSDPGCKVPDPSRAGECPNDGKHYKCGYADAVVTSKTLLGKVSMKVQSRECVETWQDDGCYSGDDDVKGIFNDILDLAYGVEVDGKVCYCSEDLCDAECGGNYWLIGTWCAKKWVLILIGIATLIAAGFLLSCCCCCCCCCRCCAKKPQGHVIMAAPTVMTSTTASSVNYVPLNESQDMRAMENPGYYNVASAGPGQAAPVTTPPAYTDVKHPIV